MKVFCYLFNLQVVYHERISINSYENIFMFSPPKRLTQCGGGNKISTVSEKLKRRGARDVEIGTTVVVVLEKDQGQDNVTDVHEQFG